MRDLVAIIVSLHSPKLPGLSTLHFIDQTDNYSDSSHKPPIYSCTKIAMVPHSDKHGTRRGPATKPGLEGEVGRSTPAPRLPPQGPPCSAATETSPPSPAEWKDPSPRGHAGIPAAALS